MREKKIKGIRRHFLVDVLGLFLCIVVHAANIQERAGGKLVLEKASGRGLPRVEKILADDGYSGQRMVEEVRDEYGWGLIADEFGLKMSGKELLDGFLTSPEYQQAMSGLDVVFTACKDFSNGKINERQVEKRLKKYLCRVGNDAADSVAELSEIFNSVTRQGLEP